MAVNLPAPEPSRLHPVVGVELGVAMAGIKKPVPLGPRAVGWLESDVSEWIAGRVKVARDGSRQLA